MKNIGSYIILLIAFGSCNTRNPESHPLKSTVEAPVSDSLNDLEIIARAEKAALATQDSTEFSLAFSNFLLTILNQDTVAFNRYIDSHIGLYIIESPGAVPQFTQVLNIADFTRSYLYLPFFSIREHFQTCQLESGLPKFSCSGINGTKLGYSKEGCFVGNAAIFKQSHMWQYAGLKARTSKQIENILPLLTKTVIHTRSSVTFHFGFIKGQWKVYFIDLMVPCSA